MGSRGLVRRFLRRDRLTGQIALATAAVLGIAAVVYGVGMASATYKLADVGAWLVSSNGPAVHVNGLSGKVDGKTGLPGTNGHKMHVVQDHGTVLIVDETTGVVSRIDPSQLQVAQTRKLGAAGTQVVVGKNSAYTVNPRQGSVQRIDPVTLATQGKPVKLAAPLGQAAIDGHAVLWVPVPASGQSAPVTAGGAGNPVAVGHAGDRLSLTVAAGVPVVVNSTSAAAMVVSAGGQRMRVSLPSSVRRSGLGGVLAPSTTDGQVVPLLAEKAGALVLVDTGSGGLKATSVRLPRHKYAAPEILGSRVYIPDESTGRVFVYDTATNHFRKSITVSGKPGPIDAFVKDGLLWINDPNGTTALVINGHGTVHRISKYTGKVPGGPHKTVPGTPHVGKTGGNENGNGGRPNGNNGDGHGADRGNGHHGDRGRKPDGRGHNAPPSPRPRHTRHHTPGPTKTVKPDPPQPQSPSNVTVTPQPGSVTVEFSPATQAKPDSYELDAPSGYTVKPKKGDAGGPYQFTASGGNCDTEVTFRVAAVYGNTKKWSTPSQPVRPCVTPGAPQGFKATAVNHGANLTWSPPANASGATTYTVGGAATWSGSGTSHSVTGLTNNRSYSFTVTAKNAAGQSGTASTSATLTPRSAQIRNTYNDDTNTIVRAGPTRNSAQIGKIYKGHYQDYTVLCQVRGQQYADEYHPERSSNIWDKFEFNGQVGYLNDIFFDTPHSGTNNFSDPPLWGCS